jgi:hypothetical protein
MKELIEYILQFGDLNKQQIDLVINKAEELHFQKNGYFSEASNIPRQVGFVVKMLFAIVTIKTKERKLHGALSAKIVWWLTMSTLKPLLLHNICKPVQIVNSLSFLNVVGRAFAYYCGLGLYQKQDSTNMHVSKIQERSGHFHLAYELSDTAFKVNAVCPGYTKLTSPAIMEGRLKLPQSGLLSMP